MRGGRSQFTGDCLVTKWGRAGEPEAEELWEWVSTWYKRLGANISCLKHQEQGDEKA